MTVPSTPTPRWSQMARAPRHRVAALAIEHLPSEPGVYAWYRDDQWQYVGKAASLRDRLWSNHLGQSQALTSSALRRNIAEHLGFGTATAIKRRQITLTTEQLTDVRAWLLACELAWLTCGSAAEATALESELLGEHRPPLNKR